MKRTHRAISLCLLLALVLTAFGIFTSFAAPAEEMLVIDDSTEYGKTVYSMDAQTSIAVVNNTYGPNLVRNEDGYWEMNFKGYDPKTAGSSGDYWLANAPTSVYINNKYSGTLDTVTNADGSTSKVDNRIISNEKNTDYFIIDFDISTNSSLLDGIYFHNRWHNNSGGDAQQNYIQLNGTDLDNFYISTHQGGTVIRPASTPDEWLNVTIVYDFSSVDEYGYAIPANWKIHVYLDGVWCGNLPNISSAAVNFYFNRISTDSGAIQNGPDASTVFANFTYKTFPRGYEGVMTQAGVLGYTGATLMDIPELKYTQQNTPYAEDKLIATIERGGESIEVYKFADIDASLQDGDVVILERSISTPFIKDSNANVTFKDKNGTVLTPGTYTKGDLVYVEKPYEMDFSAGSVIRIENDNPRKKDVTKSAVYFKSEMLASYAPAGLKDSYRYYTYVLLADTTYTTSAKPNTYADYLETDLNGYSLTLAHSHRFEVNTDTKGSYSTLKFKNGTLAHTGGEITMTSSTTSVIFDNVDYTQSGSNPFDQRGGLILYNNVRGTSKSALSNAKGSGTTRTGVIVKDSDITVTGTVAVSMGNTASGGARQGSMNTAIRIIDSKLNVSAASSVFSLEMYANSNGTYGTDAETGNAIFTPSSAAQNENDNDVWIYVEGSDVSSLKAPLITTNVVDFRAIKSSNKLDVHEKFSANQQVYIADSTVSATYLLRQIADGYYSTLAYQDNYEYDADIRIDNSALYLSNASSALVLRGSKLPGTSADIIVGAEVSAPINDDAKFIAYASGVAEGGITVTYATEGIWAKRSLPGVPAYTYTTKLDTHSYIYDGHEYEFVAYLGDPVTVDNIPQTLPAESNLLKYEWQYNIDGAWEAIVTYKGTIKANVTAASDLSLNVYLPATFGDEAYKHVYVEGRKVAVTDVVVDGVAYKAVTIPGVDPTSATKDFTVKFRVVDENGAVGNVEYKISVLDYIESALKNPAVSEEGKALVAALLNYIEKAALYNDPTATLDPALLDLLQSDEYTSIDLGTSAAVEAKSSIKDLGIFSSVRVALDTKFAYEFLVKDEFAGEITLSYLVGGILETKTLTVAGGDIVRVELLAYEVGAPITVTYDGVSAELNFSGYVSLIAEPSAELTALAEAIAVYAEKAVAYMG